MGADAAGPDQLDDHQQRNCAEIRDQQRGRAKHVLADRAVANQEAADQGPDNPDYDIERRTCTIVHTVIS